MDRTQSYMARPVVRYSAGKPAFQRDLQERVDRYFEEAGKTRYADWRAYAAALVLVTLVAALYGAIYSDRLSGIPLATAYVALGAALFAIALNVGHDATHGAYSPNPRVNRWLARAWDFSGLGSYLMTYEHVQAHHSAVNVVHYDPAADCNAAFRLNPLGPRVPWHRFQHFYIWGLYLLAPLYKWFVHDFVRLARGRCGAIRFRRYDPLEVAFLFASKIALVSATLVLPLWLLSAPWWHVVGSFLLMHMTSGALIAALVQVPHVTDRSTFVVAGADGAADCDYWTHVVLSVRDFCVDSRVVFWLCGGLNLHLAHHLFPNISYVHLPAITKIVRDTLEEHGVPYEPNATLADALASHFRALKHAAATPQVDSSARAVRVRLGGPGATAAR